jgi:hypothetical protein
MTDILDAVRIEVGRANAALIRLDLQLAKIEPDLVLAETEIDLARRALSDARIRLHTEFARRQA